MKPDPIKRSELSNLRMVMGNEDLYTKVVDGDWLKEWVGIGWVDVGMATEEHRTLYPTVIED